MLTKPARISEPAEIPPPPTGGFGFIWRYGLGWGMVGVMALLLPMGWLSLAGLPIGVALAGTTVGYTSFRRQKAPFFMPALRHGAAAGALAVVPMALFLGVATDADFFVAGGVDAADAQYAPVMMAVCVCGLALPFGVVLGALGGLAGSLLADLRGGVAG